MVQFLDEPCVNDNNCDAAKRQKNLSHAERREYFLAPCEKFFLVTLGYGVANK